MNTGLRRIFHQHGHGTILATRIDNLGVPARRRYSGFRRAAAGGFLTAQYLTDAKHRVCESSERSDTAHGAGSAGGKALADVPSSTIGEQTNR